MYNIDPFLKNLFAIFCSCPTALTLVCFLKTVSNLCLLHRFESTEGDAAIYTTRNPVSFGCVITLSTHNGYSVCYENTLICTIN